MAYPLPEFCFDRVRPLTKIDHLLEEHDKAMTTSRDEHQLSFVWAWNPGFFKSPDEIKTVLDYLWHSDKYDMDDTAWGMLNESRGDVERLIALNENNIHHHTFSFDLMIAIFESLSERNGIHFTLEDISFTRGCLSEHILILKKGGTLLLAG